jgi:hypothetical protein
VRLLRAVRCEALAPVAPFRSRCRRRRRRARAGVQMLSEPSRPLRVVRALGDRGRSDRGSDPGVRRRRAAARIPRSKHHRRCRSQRPRQRAAGLLQR